MFYAKDEIVPDILSDQVQRLATDMNRNRFERRVDNGAIV